jgi:hypothetical protein
MQKQQPPTAAAAAAAMASNPSGKIMFTLVKQTEDVKSKKVVDNGSPPLLVHFDKQGCDGDKFERNLGFLASKNSFWDFEEGLLRI